MPLTGLNNVVATVLERQGDAENRGGNDMDANVANSLILVMVNQGNTDEVMNTARAAGARGGTIIRSRFMGVEELDGLYESMQEGEKEIIAMVVPTTQRNTIMETINKKHGLKTEAGVYRLEVNSKSHYDIGCDDVQNPLDIQKVLGDARRSLHNELDIAIDAAAADFMKCKLKNIY